MKTFMEEYGKVIVVAIIVVALIGVALVFKTAGIESIKGIWKNFMTKSQLGLEISDSDSSGGGSSEEAPSGANVKTLSMRTLYQNYNTDIQYEEGMTWNQWESSKYNTNSYTVCTAFPGGFPIDINTDVVDKYKTIASNDEYIVDASSGHIYTYNPGPPDIEIVDSK